MNKEEAIEYLKRYVKTDLFYEQGHYNAIDTVLNYIEELEKENKFYKKYAIIMSTEGLLINGVKFSFNDYISKQKIRDKIKEIKIQYAEWDAYEDSVKLEVLKELLGE